jgi:hypothetical protein
MCPVSEQEAAMRIIGAGSVVSTVTRRSAIEPHNRVAPQAQGRALIAIEAPHRDERAAPSIRHPSAPFLAHLIATRMQAPQTRERRRAEPAQASAVYRSMTKPVTQRRMFGARI